MTSPDSHEAALSDDTVRIHYIKSNLFRVVHTDGVWGGLTPSLKISMAFWSERRPIPRELVFNVTPEGALGEEIRTMRVSKEGIVREVETEIVMDLNAAKALVGWLAQNIATAERLAGPTGSAEECR
ncbi:MAG: hypothetical protein IPN34_14850 [Planctomycetes bacterium]|nr:hypothetical protein [Planctomycetota bacterium]